MSTDFQKKHNFYSVPKNIGQKYVFLPPEYLFMEHLQIKDHCWHILLNLNANEKKSEPKWQPIATKLQSLGIRYELHRLSQPGDGIATAKSLCESGIRHIVAAGGDGTINEVVNGIFTSGVNTKEVFLAVLPMGRGNDWIRTHQYPQTPEETIDLWIEGRFMQHDIGLVTSTTPDKQTAERYFINIAGFGFDADVIFNVTYNPPHLFGIDVYTLSILKTLLSHKPQTIQVSAGDDFSFHGEVFMVIAAICQYNGGGVREAKYAIPDDGLLDLIVIPKTRIPQVMAQLKNMRSGDHIEKLKGVRIIQTTDVRISSEQIFRAETEGELLTVGDYHIQLIPNALNVLTAINKPQ